MLPAAIEKRGSDASFVHVDHPGDACLEDEEQDAESEDGGLLVSNSSAVLGNTAPQREEEARGTSSSGTGGTSAGTDPEQLHEAKASDLHQAQQTAYEYTAKLTAGFKSAIGGLSKTNSPGLSRLAGDLASWWGPSEPRIRSQHAEARWMQSKGQAATELQELLGLLPEENLVDSFKCKLLQTYSCSHNCYTPAIQMAFQGTLYITDQHCCFLVEEKNSKFPLKILHHDIKKAVRQRQHRKGDLSDILHLSQDSFGQHYLAFKDFEASSALDNALALVQHLMQG